MTTETNRTTTGPKATVPATWLVWFRIGLGAMVLWQAADRYLDPNWAVIHVEPALRVPMPGLSWLALDAGSVWALHLLYIGQILGAMGLMVGRGGRLLPLVLAGLMTVEFAQDAALYLNHHYLMVLLCLLQAMLPPVRPGDRAPAWSLALLRFQIGLPYVYAAVAKLDPDWLDTTVMSRMLAGRAPTFGWSVQLPHQAEVMAWGGLLLDLVCVIWLWRGPWRWLAWWLLLSFHLINSGLFGIGVFPWMMILVTPVLLPSDTMPRLRDAIVDGGLGVRLGLLAGGAVTTAITLQWSLFPGLTKTVCGAFGGVLAAFLLMEQLGRVEQPVADPVPRRWPPLVLAWIVLHLVVPFRHLAIPGDVTWTEQGHRYSWRMLLRSKKITAALVEVTEPETGQRWYLRPDELLAPFQSTDVLGRSDLIVPFARAVAERFAADGHPGVEVRVRVEASLNGRPPTLLYDPAVDLAAAAEPGWTRPDWIQPTPRAWWF